MVEDVVGHAAALGDTFTLVEGPVNAEIDPALAVFFLSFRQRPELPRHQWSHVSLTVERDAVEFVGDKREGNVVAQVEAAQNLEQRAAESSVTRRISGERRREVWAGQIAGRRAQRPESWISDRRRIAIAWQRQRLIRIGLADAGNRPPILVEVLRLPDGDAGVGHCRVDQRQQAGELENVRALLVGDLHRDLVIEARRRAKARRAVVGPESADLGLLDGTTGGGDDAIAA